MIESAIPLGWITAIVFASFVLDWLAVACDWKIIKPFSKPLALVLIIAWTITAQAGQIDPVMFLLVSAQLSGLTGDIFLLFSKRWFLWGLGAFLLGHVFYIIILIIHLHELLISSEISRLTVFEGLISLIGWAAVMIGFYAVMRSGRRSRQFSSATWIAIQIYAWILSGMVVIACLSIILQATPPLVLWLLPTGALLFLVSDFLLAYNRFVSSVKKGQLWVRIPYHLAQFSLAAAVVAIFN